MCKGDHFYKENKSLPLEEQMITAMPDIQTRILTDDDEFFIVACDGIWYVQTFKRPCVHVTALLSFQCIAFYIGIQKAVKRWLTLCTKGLQRAHMSLRTWPLFVKL